MIKKTQFYSKHPKEVEEGTILEAVFSGEFFGAVECDIQVPQEWVHNQPYETKLSPFEYFSEMCPIFCNTSIDFQDIGEHMQNFAKENHLSTKERKLLVSGMKAEKFLLSSPLLRWYLKHGMVVTKIYQVIEYNKTKCFKQFVNTVTEARREGDLNPNSTLLAQTYKLVGNSAYGGLLIRKDKHRSVKFYQGTTKVLQSANSPLFRKLTELDPFYEMYELELAKKKVILDIPIQLGFFVLQYAKLKMLEFYYDFLDVFL